jgi:AraC-like DNA-binding protein
MNGNMCSCMADSDPWLPDPAAALAGLLAEATLHCTFANDTVAPPGWHLRARRIGEGHVLMVVRGGVTYAVGGRPVALARGDAVIVAPGVVHDAWPDTAAWPVLRTCRFACRRRSDGAALAALARPFACVVRPADPAAALAWMAELRRHFLAASPFDRAACDALVLRLVAALGAAAAAPDADPPIVRLCAALERDSARRWPLAAMAREAGLSRVMLLRRFRRATGRTPAAWLIDRRCRAAAELLATTDLPLAAIATRLGYPDAFTFSRQFRTRFGHPPSRHRRE